MELLVHFRAMLDNPIIHVFMLAVVFDIMTGLAKAVGKKAANSTKGLSGLIKHLLVIVLVVVAFPYMEILGFSAYAKAIVLFYIATYGISILENLSQLGVPIPEFIKQRLDKIKDDSQK